MTTPDDDLRTWMRGAADSIDAGDVALEDVRATARRRNLRARAGAVVGVLGLVAGGVVAYVATGDSDDAGTLVSVDPTIPESSVPVDDTVATTLPEPTTPGVTVEVIQRPGVVGQAVGAGGAPEYGEWSTPWRDGFLVGAQAYTPQPLPAELPEEIVALFPPEVVELFDGELPPTIAEATEMLSDAGLLEVVSDIIAANPEASEAIYSAPVDEDGPTLDVRFTTDGVTWEPVEMTMPPGAIYFPGVTTVGDRLAVAYGTTDPRTGLNLDGVVRVASTTDLVNWDVQEVVAPPPPVVFPAGVNWSTDVVSFAGNESGWVLSVYGGASVDPEGLLPEEVRAELAGDENGYGMSTDGSGVTIERTVGDTTENDRYTWEELGIGPDVAAYLGGGGAYEPTLWASTWTGAPVSGGVDTGYGELVATSSGFMRMGDNVRFSSDGVAWTPVDLPVDDAYVSGSMTFDGGVILMVSDVAGGAEFVRVDDTGGSPVVLDLAGLPENIQSGYSASAREALVIDASEPPPPPPPLIVEYEGYRLTLDNERASLEVVDLASGAVVGEANFRDFGRDVDSNVALNDQGVTVTDPVSGEVLVAIPSDVLESASSEQNSDPEYEYDPDFWLLASRDGERFLLVDLDEGATSDYPMIGAVASNGTKVLTQIDREWVVYDLP